MSLAMIEVYSFGSIQIDGKMYCSDIIVGQGGIKPNWRRKSGHSLCLEDLEAISGWEVGILVIGTGVRGKMVVPEKTRLGLESVGIVLKIDKTPQAVKIFNELLKQGKQVAGAFHLTC